jgi:hypothetical protein
MKRKALILYTIIVPIVLIAILGYLTLGSRKSNGFDRRFKDGSAEIEKKTSSSFKLIDICQGENEAIYMTTQYPELIISVDENLENMTRFSLKLIAENKLRDNFTVVVDSPEVRIVGGNYPAILTSDLSGADSAFWIKMDGLFFTNPFHYADDRFIVRRYDTNEKESLFYIINSTGEIIRKEQDVSVRKQGQGMLTQGTMLYSREKNRFVFVYKMFNTILCLDSNLNLIYSANTIDTITDPGIGITRMGNKGRSFETFNGPPRYTNLRACLSGNNIFVYSKIKADNQDRNSPLIDVYALKDGSYSYSFFLEGLKEDELKAFAVREDKLYAICGNGRNIIKYRLINIP